MAAAMGIELLTEEQYLELQKLGEFDTKSSSWIATPADMRKLGGAAAPSYQVIGRAKLLLCPIFKNLFPPDEWD